MADALMAYPDLRHPFEEKLIHSSGSATVLYQGRKVTLSETGNGDGLLISPEDLPSVNGFELKPQGACYADMCVPMNEHLLVEQGGGQRTEPRKRGSDQESNYQHYYVGAGKECPAEAIGPCRLIDFLMCRQIICED